MDIQQDYQEYAFLEPSEARDVAEGEVEATTNTDPIYQNWLIKRNYMNDIVNRTYEVGKWYFVVAKPFDNTYNSSIEWYRHKGLDAIRKKLGKCNAYIGTKEVNSQKVHVNYVVNTVELPFVHGCNTHKYKLYVSELKTLGDRTRCLDYILKESNTRTFEEYSDYIVWSRC